MLFFDFTIKCRYDDGDNLAMVFAESKREGKEAVCELNRQLSRRIVDGKGCSAFIYSGQQDTWHMAAMVGEKEKISGKKLHGFLQQTLREMCGVKSFTVSDLREITAEAFTKARETGNNGDFVEDSWRSPLNVDLDYFNNDQFKFSEEVRDTKSLTKEKALECARAILGDQSLMEELERIYSGENVREFYGHPVHYKIVAGAQTTAMAIARLLVDALYTNGRLLGRRVGLISEIKEGCYEERDLCSVFEGAAGTTLVIEMRGSNEDHANYASAYERVVESFSDLIGKNHRNVLCIFIERADNPGFSTSLLASVEEYINLIHVSEGVGDRAEADAYLRCLVRKADFQVMDDEDIREALNEKTSYTASDLYRIYSRFYHDGLKNKLYRAYRTASFAAVKKEETKGSAYDRLQNMVGLTEVKRIIDQIIAAHKVQKMRTEVGLPKETSALHMIFSGNPGSAKTTVARLLAEILKKEGVLESGAFVECGRSDLVGRFVGWTAPQVKKKFRQARGGVLFIDEAYALVEKEGLYGDEAINTIVQEMENNRDNVIVIFAGYRDRMEDFLAKNEGLRSRIAFHVDFPDYDADELTGILTLMAKERGYQMDESILARTREIFQGACREKEFGNGRFVRNLLEQAVLKQSQRIMGNGAGQPMTREALLKLEPDDFDVNISKRYGRKNTGIGFV